MSQRIVFIGDFSGLSLFLNRGVVACGVNSVLYSNGDGWKGIPRSKHLFEAANYTIHRAWNQVLGARSVASALGPEDTLILSTEFLFNRWIDAPLLSYLLRRVGRSVLLHAGCSDGFHQLNRDKLLCLNCMKYDLHSQKCVFHNTRWPGLATVLADVDLIVPFTDVYARSAQLYGVPGSCVTSPLHFPIDFDYVSGLQYDRRVRRGIIHGHNRPGFKGTAYLREMMTVHPALAPMIELLQRMSFVDFIGRLGEAEIIVDQLFGNGYGMAGALALARGTSVAFGHTSSEPVAGFDGPGCLPVPIVGDVLVDARSLEKVLLERVDKSCHSDDIVDAARDRHDHIRIASEFLQLIS